MKAEQVNIGDIVVVRLTDEPMTVLSGVHDSDRITLHRCTESGEYQYDTFQLFELDTPEEHLRWQIEQMKMRDSIKEEYEAERASKQATRKYADQSLN